MKKSRRNQWLSMAMIVALLAASILGGCGGGNSDSGTTAATTAASTQAETTAAAAETTAAAAETKAEETTTAAAETTAAESPLLSLKGNTSPSEEEIELANTTLDDSYLSDEYHLGSDYSAYPFPEDVTLDVWIPDLYGASTVWGNMNDHIMVNKIEELTGIHVNFIVPTIGEESTAFNLMTTGGEEIPDIIFNVDKYYPGGLAAAEADGLIIELTDYADKMPNYMTMIDSDPQRAKESRTDDGKILTFYEQFIEPQGPAYGPRIKQIALDKTGWTEIPETIDEWHEFLTACKEAGFTVPLELSSNNGFVTNGFGFISSAFGAYEGLFVKDGKVAYGPMEEGIKDYLTTMNSWYEEGLIDPDFSTSDSSHRAAMAVSDDCASIVTNGATLSNGGVKYVSTLWPVLNKGDQPSIFFDARYASAENNASISTKCDNVDAALAFLDFCFTKKGWELHNFGTYGDVHLVDENGLPYYHEESLNKTDPEILELGGNYLNSKYRLHHYVGAHDEYNSATGATEQTTADTRRARDTQLGVRVPNVSLTSEEASKAASIATNLDTARSEYCLKIILGQLPVESIEEFWKMCEDFGVDEYVSIYQAAYDRYVNR